MTGPPGPLVRTAATLLCAGAVGLLGGGPARAAGPGFRGSGDPVTIEVAATLGPGSLVISVPDTEVTLPPPTLSHGGTVLTSVGRLQPITVTDNRSKDSGWTLSGVISGAAPGARGFDGQDLGWAPSLVDESPGQQIVLGLTVKPGPPTGSGLFGLAQPQVLAFTTGAPGLGTAHVSAALTLDLPTGTAPGRYSVILTLTAI